jgi:hypothetical protein
MFQRRGAKNLSDDGTKKSKKLSQNPLTNPQKCGII